LGKLLAPPSTILAAVEAARLRLLRALADLVAAERELLQEHQQPQPQTLAAGVVEQVLVDQIQLREAMAVRVLFSSVCPPHFIAEHILVHLLS
jgi:hypothetical protein